MTDVPAQRTEPDTSLTDELLEHFKVCDCHDSWDQCPCAEGGHPTDGSCDCCGDGICGSLPKPAPTDLPLTEAIAVERLVLDDPDEQALLDAYKEAKDAADKAECVVAEANDDAERACRYADDCAEALLRAKTAFAQARLKLIGVL